jgi:hypothetical protein
MIELSVIRDLVAIFGVIAGFTYYIMVVRNQRETRQAQLFMQLTSQIFSKEILRQNIELLEMQWDDLKDFYGKYDSAVNPENFAKRFNSWFMMDQVGFLLKKGLIDRELTFELMSGMQAPMLWNKFESIIKHQRDYQNLPELCVWFEYLNNEIKKMNAQRGYSTEYRDTPNIYPEEL